MIGSVMPKNVLRYTLMPEVSSRFRSLFFGGFGYVPYFLAVVYQMVGLLPRHHPYLEHHNIGRFGMRHVVAEAAQNLTWSWRTVDQVILFVAVMVGLVVFGLQLLSMMAMLFLQPALALPASWTGFFVIQNPIYRQQDLAFMMLDMVFGVRYPGPLGVDITGARGFFQSCVTSPAPCLDNFGTPYYQWNDAGGGTQQDMNVTAGGSFNPAQLGPLSSNSNTIFPFPYHLGLHQLLRVYSNGLLVIAMFIMSYFVATVLAETAQSGVPFGRRFNKTWAPLRIVLAFGLLLPMSNGLNSSQYIVLYSAKFGSAFASNGWRYFNDTLTDGFFGTDQDLISTQNLPDLSQLTQFLFTAQVCKTLYDHYRYQYEHGKDDTFAVPAANDQRYRIHPHVIGPHSGTPTQRHLLIETGTTYDNVADFLPGNGNGTTAAEVITIRFGTYHEDDNADFKANVRPICGEVHIPLTEPRNSATARQGPLLMQQAYYRIIRDFWFRQNAFNGTVGIPPQSDTANRRDIKLITDKLSLQPSDFGLTGTHDTAVDSVFAGLANTVASTTVETYRLAAETAQELTVTAEGNIASTVVSPLYMKGWAGAGIWYNTIAEMNGSMTAATFAKPLVKLYPEVLEQVKALRMKYNAENQGCELMKPELSKVDSPATLLDGTNGYEFASILWTAVDQWSGSNGLCTIKDQNDNVILSAIKQILGVDGLYALRKNQGTHPLAMLSGVGRSLVESSIRSVSYAVIISGGAVTGFIPKSLAGVSANFLVSVAMMGLIVGFVLFYVVPFLPFIYFFFAVGGWVKGIFEALVGAPLWALAHIRIDGQGLPGTAAMNGYFLIFEVFLRPILVVFGLLASISIYSALVNVLNSIFVLAVSNLGGFDISEGVGAASVVTIEFMRSLIDEFFFTVLYAILVYMLGMASFKLIDTIPNNILRWMGQSVATFGDQRENPAETLVSKASIGSQQAISKIGGGLQQAIGSVNK